ncbi:MAG: hypothetical protein ACPG8W_14125 [Candidatus Promineifilaceae bacterium]
MNRSWCFYLLLSTLLVGLASCQSAADPTPTLAPTTEATAQPTAVVEPTQSQPTATQQSVDSDTSQVALAPATLTPLPTLTDVPATATPTQTPTPLPTPTFTPTPTLAATLTPTPAPTWTPGPRPAARPPVNASPGNPSGYLSKYQMITFYGSPWGRGLGILGNSPRKQMTRYLYGLVAQYQPLDSRHAMCTWHMVTTVANVNPPEYRHVVEESTIEVWVGSADVYECGIILDIQPGRIPIQEEFRRIQRFLYHPHVHLAIDPEFDMTDTQIPNIHVGQTPAEDINWVQGELEKIAMEIGVNKVLMLHQFKDSMLPDKAAIQNLPHVELVIDSDGTFHTDIKIHNYLQYSNEPAFEYGGIKLFYNYDDWLMTPEEVMRLGPTPSIIIYQ